MVDEQTLIARAQRGDLQAYESLVRQYETTAFRAAFLVTHDEAEAADAAQDAFLRAFRALGSFRMGQPFRPWILRIVTNQALNRLQASLRRARATERFTQEMVATHEQPSPDRKLEERERSERLLQAVRELDPAEQTLIALRYFLELPEGEVSAALGIPRGTVKSRLHRTLARLRDIIQRDFPDLKDLTLTA